MKFNIEIDIDWIGEDNNLDDEFKSSIISGLTKSIEKELTKGVGERIAKDAENLIRAKTEMIINTALEKPITINNGWKSTNEYASVYDMIEERMTDLYTGKLSGKNSCEKDPLLGSIQGYVDREVSTLLDKVEKSIRKQSKIAADEAFDKNDLIKAISLAVN